MIDVGGDLFNGTPPVINQWYFLQIARATNSTPTRPVTGVQLVRRERPSGWVRIHHNQLMTELLEMGHKLTGVIKHAEEFEWLKVECWKGKMEWGVVEVIEL